MSTYVNETGESVVVSWCARPSHWPATTHDASDGLACKTQSVEVPPGALLIYDDTPRNADTITDTVEAAGLAPKE